MIKQVSPGTERTATDGQPPLGQLYDVGGRRLWLHKSGAGGSGFPAVVILPGASAVGLDYLNIHVQISEFTTAVLYDRGGTGWSEAAPLPRTAAEQAEMRAGYGIDESGRGRIARAVWEAGGLITYFTAGEPEVRAWPCEKDAPAPVAAGKIHTDFEKHFIRAEVTSVDELVAAGSMDALRAAGKLRVDGREYRVKDGDVVFFRVGRAN